MQGACLSPSDGGWAGALILPKMWFRMTPVVKRLRAFHDI
jgi:hypothetical protein